MTTWEPVRWALFILIMLNVATAAHQHGRSGRVSRGAINTAAGILFTVALLLALTNFEL
jgi:hypothetical protein